MDAPPNPPEAREPPTSFKWVIIAGVLMWLLGALMIVLARL